MNWRGESAEPYKMRLAVEGHKLQFIDKMYKDRRGKKFYCDLDRTRSARIQISVVWDDVIKMELWWAMLTTMSF